MDLSNLKPAKGSINKNSKRVGRGQGSGKGGTATRGHKGAKSRSGYSKKIRIWRWANAITKKDSKVWIYEY